MYDPNKAHYISVTGVIIKDGKYLITKRAPHLKAFPNQWTVPGGKLEIKDYTSRPKDTSAHWYNVFEHTLKREVQEETGLKIKNIKYLTSISFMNSKNIPTVIVSLFADHAEGEVKLCPESTDHAWITFEEAKNYDLIEGIYEELEMLDKHFKGKYLGTWKNN
jgi:8-oxo-dGTP diphosphatase